MPIWHKLRQFIEKPVTFTTLFKNNHNIIKNMIGKIPGGTERRQSPRFVIKQSADIVLVDGKNFSVDTRNISSLGLQVICDAWITEEIEPRGIQSHSVTHLRFKIIMDLKIADETQKLYANCRVMSAQRLSQNEYMLNLAFLNFDNGSDTILNSYLAQFTQKKTMIKATA
jgi:hypothetical protein